MSYIVYWINKMVSV